VASRRAAGGAGSTLATAGDVHRSLWPVLLLATGCLGDLEIVGVDAGGSTPPPQITVDGGAPPPPPPPGTDAGMPPVPIPGVDAGPPPPPPIPDAGAPPGIIWHAVLATGDDSIRAFDNARDSVREQFIANGVLEENIIELSRDSREQTGGVRDTTAENIGQAFRDHAIGPGDGCLMFITSHGNTTGWYIAGRSYLTPRGLDEILDEACGDAPTVALISACYSGVFVDPVQAPNRIILTAAAADRTSFGCSAEAEYTYWDGCLLDELPGATTWAGLYESIDACITRKEAGGFTPSQPQLSLGADVADLRIFDR